MEGSVRYGAVTRAPTDQTGREGRGEIRDGEERRTEDGESGKERRKRKTKQHERGQTKHLLKI